MIPGEKFKEIDSVKKNPPRISGTVPEGTGDTKPKIDRKLEQRQKEYIEFMTALETTLTNWFENKTKELEENQKGKDQIPLTRKEVRDAIKGVAQGINTSLESLRLSLKSIQDTPKIPEQKSYITREEAKQIAREAVPTALRYLDSSGNQITGNVLLLMPGGQGGTDQAYWGTVGFNVKGDKVLYKGVFLREYDEDGVVVTPGSEINPADYTTQTDYEAALTAAGHTLRMTYDWMRSGTDILS